MQKQGDEEEVVAGGRAKQHCGFWYLMLTLGLAFMHWGTVSLMSFISLNNRSHTAPGRASYVSERCTKLTFCASSHRGIKDKHVRNVEAPTNDNWCALIIIHFIVPDRLLSAEFDVFLWRQVFDVFRSQQVFGVFRSRQVVCCVSAAAGV